LWIILSKALFDLLALIRGNVCTKSDCVANVRIRFWVLNEKRYIYQNIDGGCRSKGTSKAGVDVIKNYK